IISIVLSFIAAGLNGYGFDTILYIIRIPSMRSQLQEWFGIIELWGAQLLPTTYYRLIGYYVLFLFLVVILFWTFATARNNIRKYLFYIVLAGAIVLPLLAVRSLNFIPVLVVPI